MEEWCRDAIRSCRISGQLPAPSAPLTPTPPNPLTPIACTSCRATCPCQASAGARSEHFASLPERRQKPKTGSRREAGHSGRRGPGGSARGSGPAELPGDRQSRAASSSARVRAASDTLGSHLLQIVRATVPCLRRRRSRQVAVAEAGGLNSAFSCSVPLRQTPNTHSIPTESESESVTCLRSFTHTPPLPLPS